MYCLDELPFWSMLYLQWLVLAITKWISLQGNAKVLSLQELCKENLFLSQQCVDSLCFHIVSVKLPQCCFSVSKFPSKTWLFKNVKRAEIILKLFQRLGQGRYNLPTRRACWPAVWLSQEWAVSFAISWDMGIHHDTPDFLSAQFFSESKSDQSKTEWGSPLTPSTVSWRMNIWKMNLKLLLSPHSLPYVWFGFLMDFSTFHPALLFFHLIRNLHSSHENRMFCTAQVCDWKHCLSFPGVRCLMPHILLEVFSSSVATKRKYQ